jgi:hypothetical protein
MSLGIYPVFRPKLPAAQFRVLGEVLAAECMTLHSIAEANGIASITSFGDNREIPDNFDGTPEELDELLGPFDDWYEADDAIAAFDAMLELIRTNPYETRAIDDPDNVAKELEELVRVLTIAHRSGSLFHLEMR